MKEETKEKIKKILNTKLWDDDFMCMDNKEYIMVKRIALWIQPVAFAAYIYLVYTGVIETGLK